MKSFSPLFERLEKSLQTLPGVGPRSAQRMALSLLQRKPEQARELASALHDALTTLRECVQCRVLSETERCQICADPARQTGTLLVVENPSQLLAFERAGLHDGRYFVLKGLVSPIDGLGPDDVGIPALIDACEQVQEVILALSSSVEGEATAQFIVSRLQGTRVTRLARGVPMGSDIESLDPNTLGLAMGARESLGS